jgi:adenosylhomocysteine nucleosidase
MEGASIAQVCYVNQVPFVILRTISDGAGENNEFETFAPAAAEQAIDIVLDFVRRV